MEDNDYIEDPTETSANILYNFIINEDKGKSDHKKGKSKKDSKTFLGIESPTPIPNLNLLDIKIALKYEEDKLYLKNDKVYKYLRRGNCLTYNTKTGQKGIARIGLIKFFDYRKNFSSYHSEEKRVLEKVKESKLPLSVYLTEKANGENFQVSWNSTYNCWIIGSKTVTIACRDIKDIDFYSNVDNLKRKNFSPKIMEFYTEKNMLDKRRYEYVLDFGRTWFGILDKLFKTKEELDEFKKVIANHSLIGENVGDIIHQHIKVYKEKDIIFYGIVNHLTYETEICLPLSKSFEIFKKFGLTSVPLEKSENFQNFSELKTFLDKKYDEILLKSIKESGEGNVIYIVEYENDGNERIISVAKLKTFEYRFYRKIREKIKIILERYRKHPKNLSLGDLKKSLRKESEELAENFTKELNYEKYIKFSDFVFDYIIKYDNQKDYFDVFAEFIHILKFCFNKIEEKKDNNTENQDKDNYDEEYKKIKEALDKKFGYIEKLNIK